MARIASPGFRTQIAEVSAVTLIWTLLFELNRWLFSIAELNDSISWIFLPAALRVAAVLLLGWRGAVGLFMGAMLTNHPVVGVDMLDSFARSTISAAAPLVAVGVTKRWLHLSPDLAGLTFKQLAIISIAGAAVSAIAHNIYFSFHSGSHSLVGGIVPMFGGDVLGTLIVLYVCAILLRRTNGMQG